MMKNFWTLLFVFSLCYSCMTEGDKSKVAVKLCNKVNYKVTKTDVNIINEVDSVELYFTANFDKDTVTFLNGEKIILEDIISTDHRFGIAKYLNVKNPKNGELAISINHCGKSNIGKVNGHQFIYISLVEDSICLIELTGKGRFFK